MQDKKFLLCMLSIRQKSFGRAETKYFRRGLAITCTTTGKVLLGLEGTKVRMLVEVKYNNTIAKAQKVADV